MTRQLQNNSKTPFLWPPQPSNTCKQPFQRRCEGKRDSLGRNAEDTVNGRWWRRATWRWPYCFQILSRRRSRKRDLCERLCWRFGSASSISFCKMCARYVSLRAQRRLHGSLPRQYLQIPPRPSNCLKRCTQRQARVTSPPYRCVSKFPGNPGHWFTKRTIFHCAIYALARVNSSNWNFNRIVS